MGDYIPKVSSTKYTRQQEIEKEKKQQEEEVIVLGRNSQNAETTRLSSQTEKELEELNQALAEPQKEESGGFWASIGNFFKSIFGIKDKKVEEIEEITPKEETRAPNTPTFTVAPLEEPEKSEGEKFLDELATYGGEAPQYMHRLADVLDMSEEETGEYLTYLCNSEEWGDGCIDPIVFYAQIFQESSFKIKIGDNGDSIGLGQVQEGAMKDVNDNFNKNYSSEDRSDPKKCLEISILYLKKQYDNAKNSGKYLEEDLQYVALARYNAGWKGITCEKGKEYVANIMAKLHTSGDNSKESKAIRKEYVENYIKELEEKFD